MRTLFNILAPHSSTLAWQITWMEEPGSCSPWGRKESNTTELLRFHFSLSCIGEGNGNPLQCSCLENPWWLLSMGSHRVRHDWSDLAAAAAAAMPDNRIFWVCSNISVIVYRHMPMQLLIRIAGWVMVWEIRGFIPLRGPVPDSSIGTIE